MKRIINYNLKAILDECIKNSDIECIPHKINNYENIGIGAICISRNNDDYYLRLNAEITKHYVSSWKMGVGGIVTMLFKHKDYDNFYEITFKKYKVLAYKPDNYDEIISELNDDGTNKVDVDELDIVEIGDFKYILIHVSPIEGCFSNTFNDNDENYVSMESNLVELDEDSVIEQEDQERDLESVSLF